jgi:DNA-binding SARP family transcriptional activator
VAQSAGKISIVRIGLLGPFEVRADDGVPADVPGARLRGLLTALALETGHAVPRAALVDWIWGERPPADAVNALQRPCPWTSSRAASTTGSAC